MNKVVHKIDNKIIITIEQNPSLSPNTLNNNTYRQQSQNQARTALKAFWDRHVFSQHLRSGMREPAFCRLGVTSDKFLSLAQIY